MSSLVLALLAFLPILAAAILLVGFRFPAKKAMPLVFGITVLVAFLILVMNPGSKAVNTREVDNVRKKQVLDNSDFKIIDDFLASVFRMYK